MAEELQEFADDVGEALGKIRGMAGERAMLEWAGLSADAFRREFDGVPDNLTKLEDSYSLCSQALHTYWPKLQAAQGMADRALDRAVTAQADLASAQSALGDATDWVGRAGDEAERLQREGERENVEPPDEADVRAAAREQQAAQAAAGAAQARVNDAEERLSAARQLALDAQEMREEAARECARDIDGASDAGIQNRRWWEKAIDWVTDNWDTLVEACKLVVAVLGVVVMIIGGPLAWVVLAAAVVVLADTLIKYARGEAGLLDVAFAALDCIPGMKGLTTLGGLARGLRGGLSAARSGLRGVSASLNGLRGGLQRMNRSIKRTFCRNDPVDMATGQVILSATDIALPGVLPLLLERHHRTGVKNGRWFGPSWSSTLDQRLELDDAGVRFHTAEGMSLLYPVPLAGVEDAVEPVNGPQWALAWDGLADGEMTVHQSDAGRTLHFEPVAGSAGGVLPLAAITDRHGNRVAIRYDATGAPSEVLHSGGYRVGVTTDRGRITEMRLLSGEDQPVLVSFRYHEAGDLAEVRDSADRPFSLRYDAQHRVVSWEDRIGHWYQYLYDDADRCVGTDGSGGVLACRIAYDEEQRTTTFTDSLGNATVYEFDSSYRLVAETNPFGDTLRLTWADEQRLGSVTDELGRTSRCEYDGEGRLTAFERPDGSRIRTEFDGRGLPTAVIAPDGSVRRHVYDERGNRVETVDASGERVRYGYAPSGALASVTDGQGNVTRIGSDEKGLPTEITDPQGRVARCVRDAFGRPTTVVDPIGGESSTRWSTEGKPLERVNAGGERESWEWDGEGNLLAHFERTGGITRLRYGPFGQPTRRTGPDGVPYVFTRDTELNLVRVTGPDGRSWDYSHDVRRRLTRESDFDNRVTVYDYDAAGQLVGRRNAAGQSVEYRYSARGELVGKTTSEGGNVHFERDLRGRVVNASANGVDLAREFDPSGRLVTETVNGRTLRLAYETTGRLAARTTPSGHVSRWTYSATGAPVNLDVSGRGIDFERDREGREVRRIIGDSVVLDRAWDPLGHLISQTLRNNGGADAVGIIDEYRYAYGPGARLAAVSRPGGTTRYVLDDAGRVTEVTGPDVQETYSYDVWGNQTSAHWDLDIAAESAGPRDFDGQSLIRAGSTTYVYDKAGRVCVKTKAPSTGEQATWRYSWDAENRLTTAVTPDGATWRYHYDPFGRRLGKERLSADGTSVVERVDFTWHGSLLAEEVRSTAESSEETTLTWDYNGRTPLAQTERRTHAVSQEEVDRRFHAIITDLVGTPTQLVADDGSIAWRARSTLWGLTASPPQVGRDAADTPLRSPGQYADPETGWYYNVHRYYDPEIGRYATSDPLGLAPDPNPYSFVRNPTIGSDPLGLSACDEEALLVTVYRGTRLYLENMIHQSTGWLLSDSARTAYMENGENLTDALSTSRTQHDSAVSTWGSETDYAQAHGEWGQEITEVSGDRSMISFTTDMDKAIEFAEGGQVYTAQVSPGDVIFQSLEGAGESEVLIRNGVEATPWEPTT
ncbi:DUF6531 domain-containing protein [Streptomyces sp. DSM 44915]|uniref:DUF6531 domain-containing protein n=1 Tax=Streptomyces chisholmiae TaxID=3075540 RepID=A0ABU2JPQ5_9ACTN|nr:DUF6531 domain-containing protein [Streptomyces sp. DSM 44915]MDT0266982.1 DUF6531 domain-containing protein [Streptomyces sp. DSM 44915]